MTSILLLPSPLLGGSSTWEPTAQALTGLGFRADGAQVPRESDTPDGVLADFLRQAEEHRPDVVVAHSNAGQFAPTVADAAGARSVVFVDAALPDPGDRTRLTPESLRDLLAGLADDDGLLPPWTDWWPEEDTVALFPSPEWRRRVEAEQPRLPLTWFDATIPVPVGWEHRPGAYLAFGTTYAAELARASASGWPTRSLTGGHLHQLHDPEGVAAVIRELLDELG